MATPTTTSITIVDSASTSTTGQGGQSIITGTPTTGSEAHIYFSNIKAEVLNSFSASVSGVWTGTLQFETTVDSTNWVPYDAQLIGVGTSSTTITANGTFKGNLAGVRQVRLRATATITGTAVVNFDTSGGADYNHISGSISATNPSVGTTGATAPTSATEIAYINLSGNLTPVTSAAGLPISGSITATNPSVSATGAAVPASATYIGVNRGGNIVGVTEGSAVSANSIPVVIASDNNVQTVAAQAAAITGTLTTSSSVVSENVAQFSVATVAIQGTYAGITVNFEESPDSGANWYPVLGSLSSSTVSAASTVVLATNASVLYNFSLPGVTNFRVRASAYTSGTANVTIIATGDSMVFNSAVGVIGTVTSNTAQVNGVTTLTGNGVTGTGSQRVTIASDNTAFSVNALGSATGSAVPATAFYQGVNPQTALPTAATTGQLTGMMADKFGRVVTSPYGPRGVIGATTTTITASTGATSIIAAVASQFSDIVCLILTNTSATLTSAVLSDGTNSYTFEVPANDTRGFTSGIILPATTANVAWTVACGTSVTSLFVTAIYVKNQ